MYRVNAEQLSHDGYEYWIKLDSWSVEEAVYLIHGHKPIDRIADKRFHDAEIKPGWGVPYESSVDFETDDMNTEIGQTYHLLKSSIAANKVETMDGRVRPKEFLKWAATKGIDVPNELHVLLGDTEEEIQEEEKKFIFPSNWRKKERLRVSEAAKILGVGPTRISQMVREGKLDRPARGWVTTQSVARHIDVDGD